MGIVAKYLKTAAERKRYTLDYSNWLADGETLSSTTTTITLANGDPVVSGGPTVDGTEFDPGDAPTLLGYFISGGTPGQSYLIDFVTWTSAGQKKEDGVIITIKSIV